MDNTMYSLNGSGPMGKGRLALEIVSQFCCEKPRTIKDINEAFGSVVMDEKLAKSKAEETGHKRHFLDAPIKLKSGSVVVTNQWRAADILKMIAKSEKLGFKIEVAKAEAKVKAEAKPKTPKEPKAKPPVKKAAPKKAVKKPAAKKATKK